MKILRYLLARLSEKSTVYGVLGAVMAAGLSLDDVALEALVQAVMAIASAALIFLPKEKQPDLKL